MISTTREAAAAVRLNADWQAKYRQRAQQFLLQSAPGVGNSDASQGSLDRDLPSVCVVGRSSVGKSSLINHLLRKQFSSISHLESDTEEQTFEYNSMLRIRDIPGYDGWHSVEASCFRGVLRGHFQSGSSSGSHSSGKKRRKLKLDDFIQTYGLFEDDTKAIVFVINSKITPDDEKLMELALEKRKFFCIVCTHADHLVKVADNLQKQQLAELEEQLRRDLSLLQNLNVRVFILSIPFLKDHKMEQYIIENCQKLHFPVLEVYLSQPRGLLDEIQIHAFVKEEVYKALERFLNVKKRHQALDFSQHLAAGVLLPIAGPIMVSFLKTLKHTLRACVDVGLIEDSDKAMKEVDEDANKHKLSVKIATKEGLVTAVHDSLIHIFGRVVFDIAIAEVVSTAAESAVSGAVPVAGAVVSAAHLPRRYVKIGQKLAIKACMLHELWIMQNITRLLGKT